MDWKDKYPLNTFKGETRVEIISLIESLLEEEREILAGAIEMSKQGWIDEGRNEMRLKNAGLYRQLFGEMPDKTFTAKELWKMFDEHTHLFTEEQKKELKDNLNSIMKKK